MRLKPWQPFPSGITTGDNSPGFPALDVEDALGTTTDTPATSVAGDPTAFAMLRGVLANLGVPAGDGTEVTTTELSRDVNFDMDEALGAATDPPAENTTNVSAISLFKGMLASLGV